MTSQIRLAEISDLPEILDCLEKLSDSPRMCMDELYAAFRERELTNIFTFVYVSANQIDGTASVILKRKLSHGGKYEAEISDVVAFNEGIGIGSELVRACVDFCKNNHMVYKITLDCKDELIPFYEKFGFKRVGSFMRLDK